MTEFSEKLVEETVQIIKLSGHVVGEQLIFEPWSEKSMEMLENLKTEGYSFDEKLPNDLETKIIDLAYKDRHIWAMAKNYVLRMSSDRKSLSEPAHRFALLLMSGHIQKWPRRQKTNFHRDELICILTQYLIKKYNLRVNPAFGRKRSAPFVILTAFSRLSYNGKGDLKTYSKIWEKNRRRTKYSKNYFLHRAANLAWRLQESGWQYKEKLTTTKNP